MANVRIVIGAGTVKPGKKSTFMTIAIYYTSADPAHLRELRHSADALGAAEVTEYAEFRPLLADAKAGRVQMVLVWSIGVFCVRGVAIGVKQIAGLQEAGARWLALAEHIGSHAGTMGELVAAMAEYEHLRRSRLVRGGIALAGASKRLGRPLSVDPARVRELRKGGMRLKEIATNLGASQSAVSRVVQGMGK